MSSPVIDYPVPQVDLLEDDGEPLESDWHRLEMNLLIDSVLVRFGERTDFFVGGNMFIYFDEEQARNRNVRGPDFFFVWGRPLNPPRPYWAVWLEGGRYPDFIMELSSPTTAHVDRGLKKDLYEQVFHTHEYFIYDPDARKLEGWRLVNHHYEPIVPNEKGWLWSAQLGVWLGLWEGAFQGKIAVYVRCFDEQGNLIPTPREIADGERSRADAEQARADAERARADATEAELARLRASLRQPDQKNGE